MSMTISSTMEVTDQTFEANVGTLHIIDNYQQGYGEGYETGHEEGYAHGKSDGWNDGLMLFDPMMKYYSGETNELDIPVTITKIRASAFRNHTMTEISGLGSVIFVDVYAFADCKSLAGIELENVENINVRAFYGCTALASVYMPKVLKIQRDAFCNCTSLTSITFESTPTTIDSSAFSGCTNLTTINVPWERGEVAGDSWGATNATINYEYKGV